MTTVSKLGTFLRMYLHYAGISVSDSATVNDLLTAASLPSEEEFARMKPKQVKQISDSLNRLYLDYSRLELEKRKAAAFADGSSDQKKALTAIDIQKRRIENEKDKLKGFETEPIPKLSAHYSDTKTRRYTVTASDEPTSKRQDGDAPDGHSDAQDGHSDDDILDYLSSDDDSDDLAAGGVSQNQGGEDDSDDLAGAPASKKQDEEELTLSHASKKQDEEDLLAAPLNGPRPEKLQEPDDLAELNVVVEEATDDDLKDLELELKEIGDLDLAEIEWVRNISDDDLKGLKDLVTIDNSILIDSQCSHLKEFELINDDNGLLKTGVASKSPPSGRTYTLKALPLNGGTIQRLYASSNHFCKGALQFGDSCNKSDIRICHCVRGVPCTTNVWGAHLICGHHFNSLRALYSRSETAVKAKEVAKYLGSNTRSASKPVSFKNA